MSRESAIEQAKAVPTTLPRSAIEKAVRSFLGSYPAESERAAIRRADLFSDDAVLEDPVGALPVSGKVALIEFFKGPVQAGIIIHMESDKVIVSGHEGISLTRASWGKEGTAPARVQIVHNFVLNPDGKIARLRIFFDETCVQ